ncbi:MAG: class I SAM-dependent methyltransferase [Candidatus Hydrogenedentes bacterium]|nr:class I SAM-dependent methyltransferase [Candidatus Hydrogenedentota bacterium]
MMERQPEPEAMDLEEEAAAYAAADFADVNEAFVERLVTLAGPADRALALDLGTGPGDIPLRLWRRRGGWKIVAGDVSRAMLDLARAAIGAAGAAGAVWPVEQDAKSAPFRSGAFDVVFSNSILHHITDTGRLWGEVARVSKRGTLIFLRDLARPNSAGSAMAIVKKYAGTESALLQEEYYRSLLSAYTVAEVRAQLVDAGLDGLGVEMVTDRHLDVFGRVDG